jgi:uncharacterized protein YlxW (UPF0749 family)
MKNWMIRHFLPMWAKETVLADNRSLRTENRKLKQQLRELEAYIRGLETGLRAVRSKRKETK